MDARVEIVRGGVVPGRIRFGGGADWADAVLVEAMGPDGLRLRLGACLGREPGTVEILFPGPGGGPVLFRVDGRLDAAARGPRSRGEAAFAAAVGMAVFGALHAERARGLARFTCFDRPARGGAEQIWTAEIRDDGSIEATLSNPPTMDGSDPLEARRRVYPTRDGWIHGTLTVMRRDADGCAHLVSGLSPEIRSIRSRMARVTRRLLPRVEAVAAERAREMRRSAAIGRAVGAGLSAGEIGLLLRDDRPGRRAAAVRERPRTEAGRGRHGREDRVLGQLALGL